MAEQTIEILNGWHNFVNISGGIHQYRPPTGRRPQLIDGLTPGSARFLAQLSISSTLCTVNFSHSNASQTIGIGSVRASDLFYSDGTIQLVRGSDDITFASGPRGNPSVARANLASIFNRIRNARRKQVTLTLRDFDPSKVTSFLGALGVQELTGAAIGTNELIGAALGTTEL